MSSKVLVISDLHFSHRALAEKRGFSSVEEHDEFLIEGWNMSVNKRDTVWILGDITMEKKSPYHLLDRLVGKKRVVLGNHDRPQDVAELLKHVEYVCGAAKVKGNILTHIPIHSSQLERFPMNIHGHVHEETIQDYRYFNACYENIGAAPIEIELLNTIVNHRNRGLRPPLGVLEGDLLELMASRVIIKRN